MSSDLHTLKDRTLAGGVKAYYSTATERSTMAVVAKGKKNIYIYILYTELTSSLDPFLSVRTGHIYIYIHINNTSAR